MPKKALIVVDAQNDFVPGGALPVSEGDKVVPVLNRYIAKFVDAGLPVYATRDWHPPVTKHFKKYGGLWPEHCIQGSKGAEFLPGLKLPEDVEVVSAGVDPETEGYSGFEGTNERGQGLEESLKERGVEHVYVGGLATDYCVRYTVIEARNRGFDATLLIDASRGVEVNPGDSQKAIDDMKAAGADIKTVDEISVASEKQVISDK